MRVALLLVAAVAVCLALASVSAQAPSPPPIWPSQFLARFGLYQLDVPSESPIFNETSYFSYNIDVNGQLINYPDRCVPVLPGGDESACQILFLEQGIFWNQPALGIDCCTLFPNVGPTPRNFTRGFNWNGTATAPDFYGEEKDCDFYISPDGTFKYWTELVSPPTSHHDIFFRDGGGAFWAWDHLDVTPVDPSTFDLFSDPTTCAKSCLAGLTAEEQATALERANKHGMIQLALHHHRLAEQEKTAHHHHHAHGKAPKKQH